MQGVFGVAATEGCDLRAQAVEAAKYLSEGLAKNGTLTSLKYAASLPILAVNTR